MGATVRHHMPLIAATLVFALGLAGFYVSTLTSSYTSAAVVLLSPAPGNPLTAETASSSGLQLTVAMETEEQLVSTSALRASVSEALGRQTPNDAERLQVSVRPNTQMLELRFTAGSPERAREGAQSFAEGYLDYRAEQAGASQQGRVDSLQLQVGETEADLRRAVDQAAQVDTSAYASQEVQLFAARLAQLTTALSSAESVSTDPGRVINPADLPSSSNELPAWLLFAGAGAGGLFAGVVLATLREWRRDLVRGGESQNLGIPVFTTITPSDNDALLGANGGDRHEAYRRLRAAVLANGPRPHVLAVAPVDGAESPVAAELAVVLAQAKLSVLLVATNPNNMAIRHVLGAADRPGVAEVVTHDIDSASLMVHAHGISVLPGGLDRPDARDMAATPGFRKMIGELRAQFDYIVLDGVTASGDELLLPADSVLLVLTQDRTTRVQIAAALERYAQLGISTLGAVRVRPDRRGADQTASALSSTNDVSVDRVESRANA